MAQVTRDYEMSKLNYKSLMDKQIAAEMALDMERRQQSERFIVLDRAQLPAKPIKPNRPQLYGIGSGVGLLLALVFGVLAELRRNVLLGEWELPPDVPVLARLPHIEARHTPARAEKSWFRQNKALRNASASNMLLIGAAAQRFVLTSSRDCELCTLNTSNSGGTPSA